MNCQFISSICYDYAKVITLENRMAKNFCHKFQNVKYKVIFPKSMKIPSKIL